VVGGWDLAGDYPEGDDDPKDFDGHGTKVAGVAGALTNNDEGIAGISGGWNSETEDTGVSIYAFKWYYDNGSCGGVAMAADTDGNYACDVVNCSWMARGYSDIIMPKLLTAYNVGANVIAGKKNNLSSYTWLPADCSYRNWVIGVAGYGLDGKFCDNDTYCGYHSDEGPEIDLVAPAWEIPSTDINGGITTSFSHNSSATPHVSGAVALLRSINNDLLPEDYEGILRFSADDPAPLESDGNVWTRHYRYGHGRLNVSTAVTRLDPNSDWALYSHTATGGVSAGLSDTYLCKFADGELDGYYFVQRCSVMVKVYYPETFTEIPYVWGLGQGTIGWSGSSPNYQVGWCRLIPGYQRIDKCKLFTYVYKVYESDISPIWSWYPCAPADVELHYRLWGQPSTAPPKVSTVPLPLEISIDGNYPDPFNSSTILSCQLSQAAAVNISIYNVLGQKVAVLCDGYQSAGEHSLTWDAADFPSGVYFARVKVGDSERHEKMVLLK
jgi:hypothetical protein